MTKDQTTANKWFFAVGGGPLFSYKRSDTGPRVLPPSPVFARSRSVVSPRGREARYYLYHFSSTAHPLDRPLTPARSRVPQAPLTIGQAESIGFMNGLLDEISVRSEE